VGKLKVLLVSDLHGSNAAYMKLSNVPQFYGVKDVIFAGDLLGKALVPIIDMGDHYEANGEKIKKGNIEDAIKRIRNAGQYPFMTSIDEYEKIREDRSYMERLFKDIAINELDRVLNIIEERFRKAGARLYIMPGNDDYPETIDVLNKHRSEVLIPIEGEAASIGDYSIIGLGYSNKTPWNTPREMSEDELWQSLDKLMNGVDDPRRTIVAVHVPPIDTSIDLAPRLTSDMRPIIRGGEVEMMHVGSIAVRKILETYAPIIGLHGHIHESGGVDYVESKESRIPVLNAGSEYNFGVLRGILIQIDNGKLINYLPTKG